MMTAATVVTFFAIVLFGVFLILKFWKKNKGEKK